MLPGPHQERVEGPGSITANGKSLVERCGNRYHGLDSNTQQSGDDNTVNTQVQELLEKVEELFKYNHGWYFADGVGASKEGS
ncbi:unnamed protein product [Coregonus sp. 'balchen']|nr:unnamed protein product [Coregonus sp. 'balchen']